MATTTPSTATGDAGHGTTQSTSTHPPGSNSAIEMSDINNSRPAAGEGQAGPLSDVSIPSTSPMASTFQQAGDSRPTEVAVGDSKPDQSTSTALPVSESSSKPLPSTGDAPTASSTGDAPPAITRLDSEAIGSATDESPVAVSTDAPVLIITLLLTSGARHPYKIDEKYLTKRNVTVPELTESGKKDPLSISVYTLKELILREWREEWETAPSSPSSIRLIFFGRLLDDSAKLKECRFNVDTANVVHMTVRPQDIVDDEEAAKGKNGGRDRGDAEGTAGCRCVIL